MPKRNSPSARVRSRYWWIAWSALILVLPLRVLYGSPTDVTRDLLYAALTLTCWLVERRFPRRGLLLHLVALFPLFTGHALAPGSFAQRLGESMDSILFMLVSAWPVFGLCAFWGWRGALGSALLAGAGLTLVGADGVKWGPLVATYPLILAVTVGLYFHRLLAELEILWGQLENAARIDAMTGLLNRRALSTDFARPECLGASEGRPVLLSVWDVNGLKRVNDTQGHAAGDAYLLAFVQALRSASAPGDRLYRLGGDEFAALHFDEDSGQDLYTRVTAQFPHVAGGWVPLEGQSLAELLAAADEKLYAQKANFYQTDRRLVG